MSDRPDRPASFLGSGGWVLVAALALTGAVFARHVVTLLGARTHAVGDGRNVPSYAFDLANANIPRGEIVAAGMPKDGLPALLDPPVWTLAEAEARSRGRSKFLVPSDRVIGLSLGGEARAYPLRILVWHEVVNDTLGGRPVTVTYNPLCDSAAVFDRTAGGRPLTFGVSGLLYDSNLLMYDRRPGGKGESLWSQLLFRAVAGPAAGGAGSRLELLPSVVMAWGDWRAAHPATTVLAPDPRLARQYARDPYASYFSSELLRFPVRPLPAAGEGWPPLKTPIVAVFSGGRWHASPASAVSAAGAAPTVYCSFFAWYAFHGSETVWDLRRPGAARLDGGDEAKARVVLQRPL